MLRHALFGLVFIFSSISALVAQTLTVTDIRTDEPIEYVYISSEGTQSYLVTNALGEADISSCKGAAVIGFQSFGYSPHISSYAELEKADFTLQLQPLNFDLEPMVISATRWRQSSSDVPAKIIAIKPKEVALENPQTAADLLASSGKIYVQKSQQGGGSPMIRGFATNRLLYTIDGVRMNTAIFRGGNVQNVISLDPFAIENTEVIFGPGSVIYGSDAVGGVMSFHSLTPELSARDKALVTGKAVARYSSASDERTGHLDVKLGWRKLALVTSFSSWDYGHLRQGSQGPEEYLKPYYVQRQDSTDVIITQGDKLLQIPTAYSQVNFMQKIRYAPSDKLDIGYGFHHSLTSPYGRYDRHNRVSNELPKYAVWDYGPQLWQMHNLSVSYNKAIAIADQITLRLALQKFEESRIDRFFNASEETTNTEAVDAYSVNLDFAKQISKQLQILYGAEYVLNEVNSEGEVLDILSAVRAGAAPRYPEADWSSAAIYIQGQIHATDKLSLQTGVRYNAFGLEAQFDTSYFPLPFTEADLNQSAITGSLGAKYRPDKTWVLSVNFGTAFRAPNVDDIGKIFDSEPGAVTVPNPELKAEYAYNLDLGLAKVIADMIKLDLTGYYTELDDALVRRNSQLNGQDSIWYHGELSQVQSLQNAARAHVYGLQMGVEVKFKSGISFSSDLNYQVGEEELDDGSISPSRHAAPLFGTTRLSYEHERIMLRLYTQYQAERKHEDLAQDERAKDEIYAHDNQGQTYAPAWYNLGLKLKYELSKHLSLSSGVENLTDQRYRPYSSGLSAPGRNFILAIKAKF